MLHLNTACSARVTVLSVTAMPTTIFTAFSCTVLYIIQNKSNATWPGTQRL
jgi:hypothetical protein